MKLVKKIIRLMPFIIVLVMFVFMFIQSWFVFNQTGTFDVGVFNDIISSYSSTLESELLWFFNTPFSSFFDYLNNTLSNGMSSPLLLFVMVTLTYELFMSLLFLFFDFINLVFGWANKLINKGGHLDD